MEPYSPIALQSKQPVSAPTDERADEILTKLLLTVPTFNIALAWDSYVELWYPISEAVESKVERLERISSTIFKKIKEEEAGQFDEITQISSRAISRTLQGYERLTKILPERTRLFRSSPNTQRVPKYDSDIRDHVIKMTSSSNTASAIYEFLADLVISVIPRLEQDSWSASSSALSAYKAVNEAKTWAESNNMRPWENLGEELTVVSQIMGHFYEWTLRIAGYGPIKTAEKS